MPSAVSPVSERVGDRNKEAPLERADLDHGADDPHLGLHAQEPAADRCGKPRGHAGDGRIAGFEIAVDGGKPRADRRACHGGSDGGFRHAFGGRRCKSEGTIAEVQGIRKAVGMNGISAP